jgi:glycosyltransferase involved in cell wall biosynthesis
MLPELSIVIPCYCEEKNIAHLYTAIHKHLESKIASYEFIFVDDGSRDGTWQEIEKLAKQENFVRGLRFSRNFGKECATAAGVSEARGQAVLLIDGDGQHPPDLIPKMIELWKNENFNVIECVKQDRGRESISSKWSSSLYYKLMNLSTGLDLKNSSDYKLIDRKVVDAWLQCKEWNIFFRGLVEWLGFKKTQISFEVQPRLYGESGWGFISLMRLAISTITSFSSLPLYFLLFFGIISFVVSGLAGVFVVISKAIGYSTEGFPTVILLQLIFNSTILLSVALVGVYISKIYEEVKGRPRYVIWERTT